MRGSESRLAHLHDFGQSPWFDYISRELVARGGLKRMVDRDGLGGVTSNPSIFEKAMGAGTAYDKDVLQLAREGLDATAIFDRLATSDVRAACDVLAPVYMGSGGEDGFVSIEVSPHLAYDAEATIREAQRIYAAVDRPNVLIKIPGTRECVPAVYECLCDGLNVNVTLLFSMSQYEAIATAYREALEYRLKHDRTIRASSSVASFFVSRVDTMVDALLEEQIAVATADAERQRLEGLKGKAAVANCKLVYERFSSYLERPRLAAHRRLWREGPAPALGEHGHQEPGLPRHPLRGRAHRRAHREHPARDDLESLQGPRRSGAHGGPARRGGAPCGARARTSSASSWRASARVCRRTASTCSSSPSTG